MDFEVGLGGFFDLIDVLGLVVALGYDLAWLVGLVRGVSLAGGVGQGFFFVVIYITPHLHVLYEELDGVSSRWGDLIRHLCLPQVHFSHLQQA